ncbi:MAG: hypothetical protein JWP11_661 [Frankiales bacterium]|nr:hypothetical protein [Frankiales bacterium]
MATAVASSSGDHLCSAPSGFSQATDCQAIGPDPAVSGVVPIDSTVQNFTVHLDSPAASDVTYSLYDAGGTYRTYAECVVAAGTSSCTEPTGTGFIAAGQRIVFVGFDATGKPAAASFGYTLTPYTPPPAPLGPTRRSATTGGWSR